MRPKHYQHGGIEPIDYIQANDMNFCAGNVVKYVTRYPYKSGLDDLKKARQYLDFLIETEIKRIDKLQTPVRLPGHTDSRRQAALERKFKT